MKKRTSISVIAVLLFVTTTTHAESQKGVIKSIDLTKKTFVLTVDGKDTSYKWESDKTMFLDKDGKPIQANQFAKGKKFTVESSKGVATKIVLEE